MKKAALILFSAILLCSAVACNTQEKTSSSQPSEPQQSQSSQSVEETGSEDQSVEEAGEETSEESKTEASTVLSEFSVELFPQIGSEEPVEARADFTMEMPADWKLNEDTSYQYVYYDNDFMVAIIEGENIVASPESPFEDVFEEFETTVSIAEVKLLDVPVLCHIIENKDENNENSFYSYTYYINVEDALVMVELNASDNSTETQEKFDGIISSFVLK